MHCWLSPLHRLDSYYCCHDHHYGLLYLLRGGFISSLLPLHHRWDQTGQEMVILLFLKRCCQTTVETRDVLQLIQRYPTWIDIRDVSSYTVTLEIFHNRALSTIVASAVNRWIKTIMVLPVDCLGVDKLFRCHVSINCN